MSSHVYSLTDHNQIEPLRTVEEYQLDLLLFGLLWIEYRNSIADTPRPMQLIMAGIYRMPALV